MEEMKEREAEEKLQQELFKQQVGQIQSHFFRCANTETLAMERGLVGSVFRRGSSFFSVFIGLTSLLHSPTLTRS
jgi:hypothetical protein